MGLCVCVCVCVRVQGMQISYFLGIHFFSVEFLLSVRIVVTKMFLYSSTFIFFNSKNFSEDDFASALRKKQSASWALKWYEGFVF